LKEIVSLSESQLFQLFQFPLFGNVSNEEKPIRSIFHSLLTENDRIFPPRILAGNVMLTEEEIVQIQGVEAEPSAGKMRASTRATNTPERLRGTPPMRFDANRDPPRQSPPAREFRGRTVVHEIIIDVRPSRRALLTVVAAIVADVPPRPPVRVLAPHHGNGESSPRRRRPLSGQQSQPLSADGLDAPEPAVRTPPADPPQPQPLAGKPVDNRPADGPADDAQPECVVVAVDRPPADGPADDAQPECVVVAVDRSPAGEPTRKPPAIVDANGVPLEWVPDPPATDPQPPHADSDDDLTAFARLVQAAAPAQGGKKK
jgi:hypothetical protein